MAGRRGGEVLPPDQEAGDDSRGCRRAGMAEAPGTRLPDEDQQAPARGHGREAAAGVDGGILQRKSQIRSLKSMAAAPTPCPASKGLPPAHSLRCRLLYN